MQAQTLRNTIAQSIYELVFNRGAPWHTKHTSPFAMQRMVIASHTEVAVTLWRGNLPDLASSCHPPDPALIPLVPVADFM
jgi:hypothetical protein